MDKSIEENFVKQFVEKSRRERVIFELSNDKKRGDCIRQLPTKIHTKGKTLVLKKDDEIYQALLIHEKTKPIYIISDDSRIDGTFENPEVALKNALNGGFTYILLFDHAIFFKEEVGYSSPKYVLFIE